MMIFVVSSFTSCLYGAAASTLQRSSLRNFAVDECHDTVHVGEGSAQCNRVNCCPSLSYDEMMSFDRAA